MPSASTSTLSMPTSSRSSLSHSMTVRSSIAAFSIGTTSSSRARVMTKPPTCWERWRGKPISSRASAIALASRGSVAIEADPLRLVFRDALHRPAPERAGERADRVVGEAERLADLADGAAAAIADHGGGEAGALAAILSIDVLDHLLAPLMLEIDVDVGRLAPLGRDEALEQQVDAIGIDLGDAEAIADGGIGRRAAPLAQDALGAGEADDVVHGEEERRVAELADQPQFLVQRMADLGRHAVRIAPRGAVLGEGDRAPPAASRSPDASRRDIRCASSSSEKPQRSSSRCGLGERLGRSAEQPRHLGGRLQVALGIGFEQPAGLVDRHVLADAGDDVLQRAALGRVIEHVVDGDQRHAGLRGDRLEPGQPARIVAAIEHAGGKPDRARRRGTQGAEEGRYLSPLPDPPPQVGEGREGAERGDQNSRHHDEVEPFDVRQQVVERRMHSPLSARRLPSVSRRVSRPQAARSCG